MRIEHRLQITRRTRNDAQDLAGGDLLVASLGELSLQLFYCGFVVVMCASKREHGRH